MAGCLLLADFARRIAPPELKASAAQATLWLAALCPFTAIYAATPLTEGPTLFALALALVGGGAVSRQAGVGIGALLHLCGDVGGIVAARWSLGGGGAGPRAVGWHAQRGVRTNAARSRIVRMALVCMLLALTPFAVWTMRNWRVFHVFEPLVPASATDPGDPVYSGFDEWVKTWCLDFVCTYEVYWNVPGDTLDITRLPNRAFDTPAERQRNRSAF